MKIRLLAVPAVLVGLVACGGAKQDKEAVKQGVIDHVTKNAGLNASSMDITVDNVDFKGKEATATVSFSPKGQPGQGMSMAYNLESRDGKWVVVGKGQPASGQAPHGVAMPRPTAEPSDARPQGRQPDPGTLPAGPTPTQR